MDKAKKRWTVASWNAWVDSKFPPRTNNAPTTPDIAALLRTYPGLGWKR